MCCYYYHSESCFCCSLRCVTLITLYLAVLVSILEFSATFFPIPIPELHDEQPDFLGMLIFYGVLLLAQQFMLLVTIICLHLNVKHAVLRWCMFFCAFFTLFSALIGVAFKFAYNDAKESTEFKKLYEGTEKSPEEIIVNHEDQTKTQEGRKFILPPYSYTYPILFLCFNIFVALVLSSYFRVYMLRLPPDPSTWVGCGAFYAKWKGIPVLHKSGRKKDEPENSAQKLPTQYTVSSFMARVQDFRIWCFGSTAKGQVKSNQQAVEKLSAICTNTAPVDINSNTLETERKSEKLTKIAAEEIRIC